LVKKDFPLYNTQYIDELPSILIFALAPWIDIDKYLEFDNDRKACALADLQQKTL
jgi:hypothetical protein